MICNTMVCERGIKKGKDLSYMIYARQYQQNMTGLLGIERSTRSVEVEEDFFGG